MSGLGSRAALCTLAGLSSFTTCPQPRPGSYDGRWRSKGAVQLPDELQRVIERQVAEGRPTSAAAFLEEAVLRLIDEARPEEDDIVAAAQAGIADVEAGRFSTVGTPEDGRGLHERRMALLRAGSAAED